MCKWVGHVANRSIFLSNAVCKRQSKEGREQKGVILLFARMYVSVWAPVCVCVCGVTLYCLLSADTTVSRLVLQWALMPREQSGMVQTCHRIESLEKRHLTFSLVAETKTQMC